MSRVDDDEQLEIKEIRAWADSFRAFYCTPENAEVFERDRERAHRMVRYLLAQLKDGGAASELIAVWRENQCGDKECEAVRLEAALLLLKGHESDHRYYARVVTIGKQEVEARATAPTESSERCGECVKCGHSGWLDVRGFCHQVVGAEVIDPRECGCHCIFPATEQAEEHDSCSHWREGDSDNCVWCGDNLGPTTEADVAAPATPVAQPADSTADFEPYDKCAGSDCSQCDGINCTCPHHAPHKHNCPNCFHFFDCTEAECATDYSASCPECDKQLDGVAQPIEPPRCGFCGKSEVSTLIQAAVGYICNECVKICADMIAKNEQSIAQLEADPRTTNFDWTKWEVEAVKFCDAECYAAPPSNTPTEWDILALLQERNRMACTATTTTAAVGQEIADALKPYFTNDCDAAERAGIKAATISLIADVVKPILSRYLSAQQPEVGTEKGK